MSFSIPHLYTDEERNLRVIKRTRRQETEVIPHRQIRKLWIEKEWIETVLKNMQACAWWGPERLAVGIVEEAK